MPGVRHTDNHWLEVIATTGSGGSATSGGATTGSGTAVKAVTRPTANRQTRTNGQISDFTTDENENLNVREAYAPGYEDNVYGKAIVEQRYNYMTPIGSAATTVVKSGPGFIHKLFVAGGTLGTITVYDNTAASGTVIVPTVTPTAAGILIEDVQFNTGLTIVTGSATIIVGAIR